MGIKGIYNEIGPGERIALSKLAIETLEKQGRPLRLAIDISIWLFQIQSGKGGTNPALRTFYYRLLRLICLSIHPLFVFDGPNKPPCKRGKRTGPNVASIPEFLAKQLLKQFALPFHIAPGEAEAECALLQREGIVDAVLSEDVDTLMFGSGLTMRNWSPEGTLKNMTFTHVNLYDAQKTKAGASGLDREGMILVALMSGGDYIPEGIPGCGPKTACDAARAGFGSNLCKLSRTDTIGIAAWKERLIHELRTNESKLFRSKHKALIIPDDFPRQDVLRYYTHPCVSGVAKVESLRQTLKWDQEIDVVGLRTFVGEAFDWICVSGAKKFVRNLAPALLARELRLGATDERPVYDDTDDVATRESQLIKTIHLKRQHISTDNITELRVGFVPVTLVPIDLEAEDPDPELPLDEESDGEEASTGVEAEGPDGAVKRRGPLAYDPTVLEKIWIPETLAKLGVPLKLQDWEESIRDKQNTTKGTMKRTEKAHKARGGMQVGAIDRYTKVTKPGLGFPDHTSKEGAPREDSGPQNRSSDPSPSSDIAKNPPSLPAQEIAQTLARPIFRLPPPMPPTPPRLKKSHVIDILSSPDTNTAKRKRTLRRSQSDTSSLTRNPMKDDPNLTISTTRQDRASNDVHQQDLESIPELPSSVTIRRHRSPLRRTQSISSTTDGHLHQTTLLDIKRPMFRKPTPAPSPPLPPIAHISESTAASTAEATSCNPRPPSTPKKSKNPTVIIISSSPMATPKSNQKAITAYLSPSRRKPPDSSTHSRSHQRSATSAQPAPPPLMLDMTTIMNAQSLRLDVPLGKPVFRLPLGLSQSTTLNTSRPSSDSSNSSTSTGSTNKSAASKTSSRDSTKVAAAAHEPEAHRIIRIRDSLPGTFAIMPASASASASASGLGKEAKALEGEAGRKRQRVAGAPLRQWRLSQVGVVDLT